MRTNPSSRWWPLRGAVVWAFLLLTAACDDGGPLEVEEPVALVAVSPELAELAPGDTVRLQAVARTADGDLVPGRTFTWSSGDTVVARISSSGLVTARAAGTAMISASTAGRSATAEIRVAATSVSVPVITALSPTSIQAGREAFTLTLTGSGFSPFATARWNDVPLGTTVVSPNELRVSVSAAFVVNEGTYSIVVENPHPVHVRSEPVTFTVYTPPAASIDLLVAGNAVFVENRLKLDAVARDAGGQPIVGKKVEWVSSDPTVARIDPDGRVRGRAPGSVTLTATAAPVSKAMTLHVLVAPEADVLYGSEAFATNVTEALIRHLGPGGGVSQVRPYGMPALHAAPSPDGGRVAFSAPDEAGNLDVYVVNRDGTGLARLTVDPAVDDQPAWSPDGLKIAFRSFRAGKSDVWVMNADGSAPTNLTAANVSVPEESNEHPAWSPDGHEIAFSRGFGGGQAIFGVDPTDASLRQIVSRSGANLLEPTWSPDGTTLAYRRWDVAEQKGTVEFASAVDGTPVYYFGLVLPPDAGSPAWLEGGWLAVSGRAVPGSAVRTIALLRLDSSALMVVPLEPHYGTAMQPKWVRR